MCSLVVYVLFGHSASLPPRSVTCIIVSGPYDASVARSPVITTNQLGHMSLHDVRYNSYALGPVSYNPDHPGPSPPIPAIPPRRSLIPSELEFLLSTN